MKFREEQVLQALEIWFSNNPWPPSVSELCEESGYKSKSDVHKALVGLAKEGLIVRGTKPRQIAMLKGQGSRQIRVTR